MQQSTNFKFNKPEASDYVDIDKISDAIEAIDEQLKAQQDAQKGLSERLGDAATKNVGTASGTVAAGDHTHDDRYYTESEVDNLLAKKAPAYTYGTTDLTAGTSALETGKLYFVYE